MKKISDTPKLFLRTGNTGREILTPPGHMAQLLHQLSGSQTGIPIEENDGFVLAVIPYTPTLDAALQTLVDTLISLRYATGSVQLELFSMEAV